MSANPLIDSHCHLDFEAFDKDRSEVLQRAVDNNISNIIIPGTEKKYWDRIKQLCKKHPQLHACYGLHPYWVAEQNKQDLEALESISAAIARLQSVNVAWTFARSKPIKKHSYIFLKHSWISLKAINYPWSYIQSGQLNTSSKRLRNLKILAA